MVKIKSVQEKGEIGLGKQKDPLWMIVLVFILSTVLLLEGGLSISTKSEQALLNQEPPKEKILSEYREEDWGIILYEEKGKRYLMEYHKNLIFPWYQFRIKEIVQPKYDCYQSIQLPVKTYSYKITDEEEIILYRGDLSPLFPYALFLFLISLYFISNQLSYQYKEQ